MDRIEHTITIKGLAVSTAMAGALLSGCTTTQAPSADISANAAEEAMAQGRHDRAIQNAELAVQAEPQNPAHRALLGKTYLDAGRFASAQASFDDAIALGDTSPRTALSLALSLTAQAKYSQAASLLNNWEGEIAVADHGLALALSGQPERGIHQMTNAIRAGENTVKMRQNLAFAYAVAGRWREARLMASQDVPADQVGNRMQQWAEMASPLAYQQRVAGLLGVPSGVVDEGVPVHLALANNPSIDQIAAEATALAAATNANGELPAIGEVAETAPAAASPAPVSPAPVSVADDGRVSITAAAAELPSVGNPVTPVGRYSAPSAQSADDFAQAFEAEKASQEFAAAPAPMPQMERGTDIVFVSNPVIQALPANYRPAGELATAFAHADTDTPEQEVAPEPVAEREVAKVETVEAPAAEFAEREVSGRMVAPRISGRVSGQNVASSNVDAPAATSDFAAAASNAQTSSQIDLSENTQTADSSHLVQLGSFYSRVSAERAWDIYVRRYPELNDHEMVITEAMLGGRRYFRVSADGFGRADSEDMCAQVASASDEGCISWAMANPLPGAVDTGIRLASR